ncbi:oxidoreductase, short chain dehydrogenase/reductase family protein [Aeromicrobium marinum DSM 15272]|uniref:Oxidoreductase, short chain dehydrogenase/reductase family protein n=1 Tax=Aeromicrobium marinum DSM 15272 TaxID=585531 RepID=E2S7U7_9ACTN|nr:SDR family oxidoreductase [Aeromicrobium marinum]EFQ84763.1 oxidoreductase, short chain dehydrogenase/reductase family protein [Aeromicrobium marinum DSM 15272]
MNDSSDDAAFPAQRQDPPGVTDEMRPQPDHGESSYRGHDRLAGKVALITGGDSGIGRAVAIAYAREGADVAFTHLPGEERDAESTSALVESAGRRVLAIEADLRDSSACRAAVLDTVERLGTIDILVNNAGHQMARDAGIEDMDDERIDRTIRTNLHALLYLVRSALPHLRGSRGCIINNTSIQAYEPSTSLLDYAATKAAINNLTVNLAADLGPEGIRVNAVAPGPIWTPLQPATQPEEKLANFGRDTPLGRAGQPAEVAPAFVFLADEASAGYVSGTVLGVTGGKPVF